MKQPMNINIPFKHLTTEPALLNYGFALLFSLFGFSVIAQTNISLEAAIDTALKNNLQIKNEMLRASYQQKLMQTGFDLPQTNLSLEAGQINSYYKDNRVGLSQAFSFPTVYTKQKTVLKESWKTAVIGVAVKEIEIRKTVSEVFYALVLLNQKEALLQKADSNYAEFLSKANLRFEQGESNLLEKITAENQRGTIQLQLKALKQEIEITQLQFQLLLNVTTTYKPVAVNSKYSLTNTAELNKVMQHPSLTLLAQQQLSASATLQLEKARLLPELGFGVYNMSMQGTGSNNVTYDRSTRFNSAQLSIGLPLFYGAQKGKIKAAEANGALAENQYLEQKQVLENHLKMALSKYNNQLEAIAYYEKTALPNAQTLFKTANQQFIAGEINYLDWVILNNQAIEIQNNYLEAIKALNETGIEINYLISKN